MKSGKKQHTLQAKRKELSTRQEEHHGGNEEFKTALSTMVLLSSKALETFKSSKTSIQRSLISFIFSNLQLRGEKLQWTLAEPFASFVNSGDCKEWLSLLNYYRTTKSKYMLIVGFHGKHYRIKRAEEFKA